MDMTWITATVGALLMVVLGAVVIYLALILFTRLAGLRSFSKISSFDFAVTVGIATVFAGTLMAEDPPLLQGIVALGTLYLLQATVGKLRRHRSVSRIVDNQALLLMAGREILHENLHRARITENDLRAKLREANVIDPGEIRAVVMESTGDVSVLHGPPDGAELDLDLLAGVRGVERLREAGARRAGGNGGEERQ